MSIAINNRENVILKIAIALFSIAEIFGYVFLESKYNFMVGLFIGTFLSVFKYRVNDIFFTKVLFDSKTSSKVPSKIVLSIISIFSFLGVALIAFLMLNGLKMFNVYTAVGILIGVSFIPLGILTEGILEMLYIFQYKK